MVHDIARGDSRGASFSGGLPTNLASRNLIWRTFEIEICNEYPTQAILDRLLRMKTVKWAFTSLAEDNISNDAALGASKSRDGFARI